MSEDLGSMTYRPLLDRFDIKKSNIEGRGLFSTTKILQDESFESHISIGCKKLVRTPIGGHINHSEDPNVGLLTISSPDRCYTEYRIFALRDIKPGEEITIDYNKYKMCGKC